MNIACRPRNGRFLCFVLFWITAAPVTAQLWSQTGDIIDQDMLEWQQASTRDKVATTGSFLNGLRATGNMESQMAARMTSDRDLQPLAEILAMCIDGKSPVERDPEENRAAYEGKDVSAFAASCILELGWAKNGF